MKPKPSISGIMRSRRIKLGGDSDKRSSASRAVRSLDDLQPVLRERAPDDLSHRVVILDEEHGTRRCVVPKFLEDVDEAIAVDRLRHILGGAEL